MNNLDVVGGTVLRGVQFMSLGHARARVKINLSSLGYCFMQIIIGLNKYKYLGINCVKYYLNYFLERSQTYFLNGLNGTDNDNDDVGARPAMTTRRTTTARRGGDVDVIVKGTPRRDREIER